MRCFFTELRNPFRNPDGFEINLRIEGIRKLRFYLRPSGLFNESAMCELARLDTTDRCVGRRRSFRNSGTHVQCRPAERLVSGQLQTRNPYIDSLGMFKFKSAIYTGKNPLGHIHLGWVTAKKMESTTTARHRRSRLKSNPRWLSNVRERTVPLSPGKKALCTTQ
jgi:hypothetical protein